MARLQILELPEGSGDDRPPFILVLDQITDGESERIIAAQDSFNGAAKAAGARAVVAFHGMTVEIPANDTTAYLSDEARQAKPLRAERMEDQLAEARQWARHGYEIGQRHCGWSDHGVAPEWLTEGWPPHFDACDHLKQMAEFDEALTRVKAVLADPSAIDWRRRIQAAIDQGEEQ